MVSFCLKLSISVLSSGLTFRDVNKEAILVVAGSHLVTMRVVRRLSQYKEGRGARGAGENGARGLVKLDFPAS